MSNINVFIDRLLCVSVLVCIMIWPILAVLGNADKIAYKLVLTWLVDIDASQQSKAHPVTKGSKFDGKNQAVIPRM